MQQVFKWIFTHWKALSVITATAVVILSLYPLPQLPNIPGTDKSHHFIAYALLFFPIALHQPRYWLRIGFVIILLSGLIELIQPWVNRYGEWLDLLANTAGVLVGGCVGALSRKLLIKKPRN